MAATRVEPSAVQLLARRKQVADAFAPGGALASLPGFVARPSQQEMALAVFDAIVEQGTLVVEAGTGTGKTLAYLVPTLLAGGKALVSVGSKTLQDQVHNKDLPLVDRALGIQTDAVLLKGRQNYVCLHRLKRTSGDGLLETREAASQLQQIERFARISPSGDRAELSTVPETAGIWHAVTSTQDNCLGAECPQFDQCFVYRARRRALTAQVVVVNHHLFLADMALRDDRFGELLPTVDTVVLDEAHQLPRIGTEFFGENWSLAQIGEVASDTLAAGMHATRACAP
jgi:ATP-dependent DNA helicase DinG